MCDCAPPPSGSESEVLRMFISKVKEVKGV